MPIAHTSDLLLVFGRFPDDDLEVLEGVGVEESFGGGREGVCPVCPVVARREGDAVDDCHWRTEHDDGFFINGGSGSGLQRGWRGVEDRVGGHLCS